jgi:hypothetical protein
MNAKAILLVILNLFCAVALFGGDLNKPEQEKLRKAFSKGQEFFLIPLYLEGGVRGYTTYEIHENLLPRLKPYRGAGSQPDLSLLRGDKVIIEKINASGDYFELLIKAVEWKTVHFSPRAKFYGTLLLGLPALAATQGDSKFQPDVKLRFFGKSAGVVQTLVAQILSEKKPSSDLKPGMSPDEVLKILGDPSEIINFGNKKTFRYANKEVIFVDEKLTDVVFGDSGVKK